MLAGEVDKKKLPLRNFDAWKMHPALVHFRTFMWPEPLFIIAVDYFTTLMEINCDRS